MFFLQGDIFLKVPPDILANKYLGFTAMNSWKSVLHYANPKYLSHASKQVDIALKRKHCWTIDLKAESNDSAS